MFGKDKASAGHYDTLISNKTTIVGDVHFQGGLHIDGVVKGNLIAEDKSGAVVRISDKGLVEGEIRAPNVIVNGTVKGDVHSSDHIELAKKARVSGDVYYTMMEMVMGAQVNGSLVHVGKSSSKSEPKPTEAIDVAESSAKPSDNTPQ